MDPPAARSHIKRAGIRRVKRQARTVALPRGRSPPSVHLAPARGPIRAPEYPTGNRGVNVVRVIWIDHKRTNGVPLATEPQGSPEFIAFHVAPRSTLFNTPIDPQAYTVLESRGSIVRILTATHSSQPPIESSGTGRSFQFSPRSMLFITRPTSATYSVRGICGSIASAVTRFPNKPEDVQFVPPSVLWKSVPKLGGDAPAA